MNDETDNSGSAQKFSFKTNKGENMKQPKSYQPVWAALLALLFGWLAAEKAPAQIYNRQYAVVIGINKYPHPQWTDLTYAQNDAKGIAQLMQQLGFTVRELYDTQATRTSIVSLLEDEIAPGLHEDDAVFFFFAGHGTTRRLGGKDWGYIVPSDATDKDASLISMEELLTLSEKMGTAKHQLFIMDCCFGGLLGKERVEKIPENRAYYLQEVGSRKARQIFTAGGENQMVADGGPEDHSVFTGYLIKGIRDHQADVNGDGWITFSELTTYVSPAASNRGQTPGIRLLPGHELGEFLFPVSKQPPAPDSHMTTAQPRLDSSTDYISLEQAKAMLIANGFYDAEKNRGGRGVEHQYRPLVREGRQFVIDDKTRLMWQQGGSDKLMTYAQAENYVRDLNNRRIGGYGDWRLPTLEEAMSLMEKEKKNGDLHIDSVFDRKQSWIWTANNVAEGQAWGVDFVVGDCHHADVGSESHYVRVVRTVP